MLVSTEIACLPLSRLCNTVLTEEKAKSVFEWFLYSYPAILFWQTNSLFLIG